MTQSTKVTGKTSKLELQGESLVWDHEDRKSGGHSQCTCPEPQQQDLLGCSQGRREQRARGGD